jgi:pilin isopeptide linkage protein
VGGVTYDSSRFAVKVVVTDDGVGALHAAQTVYALASDNTVGDEMRDISFRNTYAVTKVTPASLTLTAAKTLSGKTLTAKAFNFAVTENGTTVATGTNDADGLVTFSAINYTTSDRGRRLTPTRSPRPAPTATA